MVWIRNNKFLAGFIAIMVLGIGGLTYLLIDSMGQYDQVAQDYDTQVRELKRLQGLKPFPSQENVGKYQEVKAGYKTAVDDLQTKMASFEPPPEVPPVTPTQFQDRLRRVVDDVTKFAQQNGVSYPEDFYLGFERYRNALPEAGATPLLSSQLDNLQELVGILIKERVEKITAVKRMILPQENGAGDTSTAQRARGGPNTAAAPELVTKYPVVLEFSGPPSAFRAALNDVTHSKRLFILRAVKVNNQSDKGPVRGQEPPQGGNGNQPPAPQTAAESNPASGEPLPEKGPPPLRYVVGQEKLDVIVRIELAKVAPPR